MNDSKSGSTKARRSPISLALLAAALTGAMGVLTGCSSTETADGSTGQATAGGVSASASASAVRDTAPATRDGAEAAPAATESEPAGAKAAVTSGSGKGKTAKATAAEPAKPAKLRLVPLRISADTAEDPLPQNPLGPSPRNFRSRLDLLRQIASDDGVAGVELELRGVPDFAHAIDLLEELRAVRAAGKKIVCWDETLDQRELLFASLADLLAMPPGGLVALEGFTVESLYFKDLLEKLHVRMEVMHVGDFKTGYEELGRSTMSAEQRLTIEALLDEFYEQLLDTVSEQREMPRAALEALYQRVAVMPEEARAAGLIDAVAYRAEFDAQVEALLGGEFERVEHYGDKGAEELKAMLNNPFAIFAMLPKLLDPPAAEAPKSPYVAVVYATGVITSGKSQAGWDGKVTSMGSDTVVEALDKTADDANCKAVVLRVNSPGGSALASDAIWGAIQRVKAKKPVVSSMGQVAGSGGYWISMGCSAIVAQPSTITGSIGVLSMVPDLSGALDTIGVNVEVVARGPHGDQLSLLANGPTPLLRETITRLMQHTYDEFLDKVSEGRRLPRERVAEMARGRVYTGRQAADLGLVDELGGLRDAIAMACVMGGGLDAATTPVFELPEPPNFMQAIEDAMEGMVHAGPAFAAALAGGSPAAPGLGALSASADLPLSALHALSVLPGARAFVEVLVRQIAMREPLHAERVQVLMPGAFTIR